MENDTVDVNCAPGENVKSCFKEDETASEHSKIPKEGVLNVNSVHNETPFGINEFNYSSAIRFYKGHCLM
jgi:hypothetical protein